MLNQCQFIGNLGADPEMKRMSNGNPVVNLSLAVTEKWRAKDSGEQKEKTEWVRCVIFSEGLCKVAEQYLHKGSKVYLSGKWQTRSWEDQSGQKKYSTELVLNGFESKLVMLDGPKDRDNGSQGQSSGYGGNPSGTAGGGFGGQSGGAGGYQAPLGDDEEIPF